ncbi:hypothetical protein [Phenylobacterium sp.]|uniref:hypothetical protein n=1 Tax=Phenylobacterium sp. TaxID=1871053 RepID=UPI002DF3B65E|nr:hypothetical protein [Phenylobacterium sp.]
MRTAILGLALALSSGAALAQTAPVSTAPPEAPVAGSPSVADQIDAFIKTTPVPNVAKDAAPGVTSSAEPPERKIHGVVELGVGSGGYRHAYARADVPVGETGQLSIAVDQTRFNERLRGGRFGPGRFGAGATSLSFAGAWSPDEPGPPGAPCRPRADGDLSRPDYGSALPGPGGACRILERGAP